MEKVENRIVILKPAASLSTSAPPSQTHCWQEVTCCSEIVPSKSRSNVGVLSLLVPSPPRLSSLFVPTPSAISATSLPELTATQHCSLSVYGCCTDNTTAALGVGLAGCPSKSSSYLPLPPFASDVSRVCCVRFFKSVDNIRLFQHTGRIVLDCSYTSKVAQLKMFHLNPRNNYGNFTLYQQKNLFI